MKHIYYNETSPKYVNIWRHVVTYLLLDVPKNEHIEQTYIYTRHMIRFCFLPGGFGHRQAQSNRFEEVPSCRPGVATMTSKGFVVLFGPVIVKL